MHSQVGDTPRIYIVDDDLNFLIALRRLLSSEGFDVQAFDSPSDFLAAHDPGRPGCLLLDLKMTEMTGLDVQSVLLAGGETRPIIFITGETGIQSGVTAMKRGARDYLTKPVEPDILLAAVQDAIKEDAKRRSARTGQNELMDRWNALSPREKQIMNCVARGLLNKQIAFDLQVSEKTVKFHRGRAMRKMKARSPTDIAQITALIGPGNQ